MGNTNDKKAAAEPSEKKETWINYLAFTTVIFAALATLSTFKGGGFSSRSVVLQAQASDQWAYFQAKSIRESLYRIQKENLNLQLGLLASSNAPEEKEKITQALVQAESKVEKYETEKNDIEKAARALEQSRDEAQTHGKPLGLAVIFLQIAIVLSSIGGLLKRKEVWYLGLPVGLAGIILFSDGFLLFLPASWF